MANFGTNCHKLGATFSGKTINESYIGRALLGPVEDEGPKFQNGQI